MPTTCLASFPTTIGPCALAWSGALIRGVQLPESTAAATLTRLARRWPGSEVAEPAGAAAEAIAAIVALLQGEPRDLLDIALDEGLLSDFDRRVYRAARDVGPGSTSTYGAIATAIGTAGEARAVGQSLGRNPFPIVVPCHRILAAGGKTGGFSGAGGVEAKLRMLTIERARIGEAPSLFGEEALPLASKPRTSRA